MGTTKVKGDAQLQELYLLADGTRIVSGGLAVGLAHPQVLEQGHLFLHDGSVDDVGFVEVEDTLFLSANVYYNGSIWLAIATGKSSILTLDNEGGLIFLADTTSRTAGTETTQVVKWTVDTDGNILIAGNITTGGTGDIRIGGGLYVGGVGVDPVQGEITTTGDVLIGGGLRADGGIASGDLSPGEGEFFTYGDVRINAALYIGVVDADPQPGELTVTSAVGIGMSPPATTIPQIYLDAGATSYGMISSGHNFYLGSNTYWNGSIWKTLEAGKSSVLTMQPRSGKVLALTYDWTERAADEATSSTEMMKVDTSGNLLMYGGMTLGSTANSPGQGDLRLAGGIALKAAVDVDAPAGRIYIYSGTTLVGDLKVSDVTWFRINETSGKKIWIPNDLYMGGHFTIGSSSVQGSDGDVMYTGNLRPYRGAAYTGYLFVPIAVVNGTGWTGGGRSTSGPSSITVSTTFSGVPSGAKAVLLRQIARDSAGWGSPSTPQVNLYFGVGATSANPFDMSCHPIGLDAQAENMGIVNIITANTIYYRIAASGGSTMDCWLMCTGYWI